MGSLKYLIIAGIMLLAVQADAATVVGQPTFGGYTTAMIGRLAAKAPTASPVFSGPVTFGAVLFAALSTPVNGSFVYCSDCTVATPATCTANLLTSCVCAGSGTGALAKRLNGNWYCN